MLSEYHFNIQNAKTIDTWVFDDYDQGNIQMCLDLSYMWI